MEYSLLGMGSSLHFSAVTHKVIQPEMKKMRAVITERRSQDTVTLKRTRGTDELDMRAQHTYMTTIVLRRIKGEY